MSPFVDLYRKKVLIVSEKDGASRVWTARLLVLAVFLPFFLLVSNPATCQAPPDVEQILRQGQMELSRESIRARRQVLIAGNLPLTPAQGEIFWPIFREYRDEMVVIEDRRDKIILEFISLGGHLTEDRAASMLDGLLEIRLRKVKIERKWSKKLLRALPATVVARFFQIENKLDILVQRELTDQVPLLR